MRLRNKTPNSRWPTTATSAVAAALLSAQLHAQPADPGVRQPPAEQGFIDSSESSVAYLRRARDTLIGLKDFVAALNPARQIVAEQERAADPSYPADLLALARIRAELGEAEEAENNFLEGIEMIARAEGEFSITLVAPYQNLGRAYIKSARYPEAIAALEQAQHISQRNLGLFNVEQAGLLDDITTAYLGLGNTVEARKMQLERLDNAVKRFGADDPRVIPFRYQLADYYRRSRMQVSAREQYAEVLTSQQEQLGPSHPSLLSPLRELVKVDLIVTQGEEDQAYTRLIELLARNGDADPVERGLSLAVLGDWATVTGDSVAARDYYKQAWDALSSKPDIDAAAFFAQPQMIDFIAPLSPVDRGTQSKPYAWGSMVFEFDLSADGRPSDVHAVGVDARQASLLSRYTRRIRETHFRPRLVAGEPVSTDDVQFTHYFRFYVNEKDEKEEG